MNFKEIIINQVTEFLETYEIKTNFVVIRFTPTNNDVNVMVEQCGKMVTHAVTSNDLPNYKRGLIKTIFINKVQKQCKEKNFNLLHVNIAIDVNKKEMDFYCENEQNELLTF